MFSKLLSWIKNLPNTLRLLIGLIAVVIPLVILIRTNLELSIVVAAAICVVAIISSLAYVLVAKDSTIRGLSPAPVNPYRYPRHRKLAAVGICVIIALCVLTLGYKPSRNIILAALSGTKLAPRADFLIAEFDARHATRKYEIANRFKRSLETQLTKFKVDANSVQTLPAPIESAQDAKAAIEESGCKVLVWGWYDDLGITVNISTPESLLNDYALKMKEVAWIDDPQSANGISLHIRKNLPDDISFLSLVIIGSVEYQNNHYEQGYKAFDAAMNSLPEQIALENASVLHFFLARMLAVRSPSDAERAICEYSKAIQLNPRAFAAYNNLGILVANLYIAYDKETRGWIDEPPPDFQLPGQSKRCLDSIGVQRYEELFERALELQPDSALVRYNQLAADWVIENNETLHGYDVNATLDSIIKTDPTIPGAHVLRGVLAFDEGELFDSRSGFAPFEEGDVSEPKPNPQKRALEKTLTQLTARSLSESRPLEERRFKTALGEFSLASALLPRSFELQINIGKVYLRNGIYAKARTAFEKASYLKPDNLEPKLALADVAIREKTQKLRYAILRE
jgi:tetratricopeptide (TPR) repeat protein